VRIRLLALLTLLTLLIGSSAVLAGCGDDDDSGGGGVTVLSPESEPDPEADPDPEAGAVTPEPRPDDATEVDVTLTEFAIEPSATSAPAGNVYFLVANDGPNDPHEFVVIKSDLAPDALPVEDGKVPEDEVDFIDEIEPFAVGSTGSITLDLEAGSYVLICNIVEVEADGKIESHYEEGMRAAFTVE
jgi:uncharacterized cupredoxin-like copper-binding protein